ncbi:hypothetical protein [Moraxella lacunata]|uniref:hypothetical protein n=1 Tax=Moraxella lacunata TaxID=477 RepID=UPI003EDF7294
MTSTSVLKPSNKGDRYKKNPIMTAITAPTNIQSRLISPDDVRTFCLRLIGLS